MNGKWKALFVGDVVIQQVPKYKFLSDSFAEYMEMHQICSCNFEAPIRGSGSPINKVGPHLTQHQLAPDLIEKAGFNVICLANNHIYDYGEEGLSQTISSFKKSVLSGAGNNYHDAYALKQLVVNGVKVGFLSYGEAQFGALTLYQHNRGGFAWINHPSVKDIVKKSKEEVDVLIILVHAGLEDHDLPLPEWRERYRELIDLGADAIIGSHPHVPQGWESYREKPIFYSLGNFYFDGKSDDPFWNKGLAVSLSFDSKDLQSFKVLGIEKTKDGIVFNNSEDFLNHLKHLNIILDEPVYSENISIAVSLLWDKYYKSYYEIAVNAVSSESSFKEFMIHVAKRLFSKGKLEPNLSFLLHNIRIESHRWVVERALSQKVGL